MPAEDKDNTPISGDSLDQLLSDARWPVVPQPAVARVAQHWETVWNARQRREVFLRRMAALGLAATLLGAVTIGWLRLRLGDKSIADTKPLQEISPKQSAPTIEPTPVVTKALQSNDAAQHETRRPAIAAHDVSIDRTHGPNAFTDLPADVVPSRPPNTLEELMLAASDHKRKHSPTSARVAKPSPPRKLGSNSLVNAPRKTRRKAPVSAEPSPREILIVSGAIDRLVADSKVNVVKVGTELSTSAPNPEKLLLLTLSRGTRPQQIAALRLLAETGSTASIGPLLRAAEEPQLHAASVEALARLADPSIVREAARLEPDSELQRTLMAALLARGEPGALGEFLSFVENDRTADAALAATQLVKKPPMDLLFSTFSEPLEAHRIAAARVIGRIDGASTTQRLITMVELGVNRHEACIALLSSRGREATRYVNAAAQRDPSLAAIFSGARMFTQLDNPPRS
ncbi:MAG TPA: hypothetical protein VFG04_20765 [Planctomycetaceae bacterium]|jgi:hypothetical protein|nr:hypothetical protein [Planctomycetaceae bacterium]